MYKFLALFVLIGLLFGGVVMPSAKAQEESTTLCGGKPAEVGETKVRQLFFDEEAEVLWLGAVSGEVFASSGSYTELCLKTTFTVNAFAKHESVLYVGLDGGFILSWDGQHWTQHVPKNESINSSVYYILVYDDKVYVATLNGITVLNGDDWEAPKEFDYPEIASQKIHAIINIDGTWCFGTHDQGVLCFDPVNGEWKWYYESSAFVLSEGGDFWLPIDFVGFMPANVRDFDIFKGLLVVAADDADGRGFTMLDLKTSTSSNSLNMPFTQFTSVTVYEDDNGLFTFIFTDWLHGAVLVNGANIQILTETPSLDSVVVENRIYIATEEGIEIYTLPDISQ